MSETKRAGHGFVRELHRRRVLPAAIAYGVAAWALVEALDLLTGTFDLSDKVMRVVIVIAALGFPIAVAVAWVFDISIEGISRTGDDPGDWNDVVAADTLAPERKRRLKQVELALVSCSPVRNASSLDPEEVLELHTAAGQQFAQTVAQYGGTVVRDPGLALQAVFGYPGKKRDDLQRALQCARALAGAAFSVPPDLTTEPQAPQVGLHSGPVLVPKWRNRTRYPLQDAVLGRTGRLAARVSQAAAPGQILMSAAAREKLSGIASTQPADTLDADSESEPVEVFTIDCAEGA